jgi:hypothetical protein
MPKIPTRNKKNAQEMKTQLEKEAFEFLDKLRESGITNMFGATPYLEDKFDLENRHARILLIKWMENYNLLRDTGEGKSSKNSSNPSN